MINPGCALCKGKGKIAVGEDNLKIDCPDCVDWTENIYKRTIRRLEDQLVAAREALEPFATIHDHWENTDQSVFHFDITDYLYVYGEGIDKDDAFKHAADVYRKLTACDHDWQTTSEAPVVLYQTCSKCGETRRVEKADDDGQAT